MGYITSEKRAELIRALKADCSKCGGLCCVVLYCLKTDGFPADKEAGVPCSYLMNDFRCKIHGELHRRKLRGCLAYDCLGAGQKVTQRHALGAEWSRNEAVTASVYNEFQIIFRLHEIEWYLLEAASTGVDEQLRTEVEALIVENERITSLPSEQLLHVDLDAYCKEANRLLKQVISIRSKTPYRQTEKDYFGHNFRGANLNNKDFSMALLIAADLEGCRVDGTVFLGADFRGANIRNVDLSSSLFLTQMQINSAHGNAHTILPANLTRPNTWT